MEEDLTIRGSLEESAIPELLRSVCKNKESGVLTCYIREHKKSVFIEKGQMVFATSSSMDDWLGEFLLRSGRLTVRGFLDATKFVRPGKRLGAILCDNGVISPDDLVDGVRDQVRSIIISLFDVVKGTYELVLKAVDTQEMILLNSTPEEIIFAGTKTVTSWMRISKGISSFTSVLVPAADSDKVLLNLSLDSEESHLFSLCEKRQFKVEDICGMSYVSNFDTCRILWAFLMIGALEIQESAELGEVPRYVPSSADLEADLNDLVEGYNDIYSHIYEYSQQKIGDDADGLAQRAIIQVQGTMPNVTKNLKLDPYGRLDFDVILRNLSPIPETGRLELVSAALEEIVYAMLSEVGALFGSEDQTVLAEDVKRIKSSAR
jgi:Domain of unknown function (DUF4388)